ncbi:hypothetical protein, partial [Streptomyces rimosus]|uniref:hypothetical protein n=1 Tax=Streptomyces rimosus TaxID=1927 RepID=UPI001F205FCC
MSEHQHHRSAAAPPGPAGSTGHRGLRGYPLCDVTVSDLHGESALASTLSARGRLTAPWTLRSRPCCSACVRPRPS